MSAVISNVTIDQGEDWSHIYQYVAPDGSYIVMHDPAAFVISDPRSNAEIFRLNDVIFEEGDPVGGFPGQPLGVEGEQVRVTLARSVTASLPVGRWEYGLTVTCGSQTVPLARGIATVRVARGKVA